MSECVCVQADRALSDIQGMVGCVYVQGRSFTHECMCVYGARGGRGVGVHAGVYMRVCMSIEAIRSAVGPKLV